jgi:protein-S-isoprenylcysteine O-methyltransferase Ste14
MATEHDPPGETPPDTVAPELEAEREPEPEAAVAADAPERLNSHNMLPPRERRRSGFERLVVRLIATAGIVGIGVAIAAIMVSSNSKGWVVGLVVSIVSVVLAAVLWSSRQL